MLTNHTHTCVDCGTPTKTAGAKRCERCSKRRNARILADKNIAARTGDQSTCPYCGESFYRKPSYKAIFCGSKCYRASAREKGLPQRVARSIQTCQECQASFAWLPGQGLGKFCSKRCWYQSKRKPSMANGYRWVWDGERRVLEHRLIVERSLGRQLKSDEHVHHINGNRADNQLKKLRLMTRSEHMSLHKSKPWAPLACENCGITFLVNPFRKHTARFCSIPCRWEYHRRTFTHGHELQEQ